MSDLSKPRGDSVPLKRPSRSSQISPSTAIKTLLLGAAIAFPYLTDARLYMVAAIDVFIMAAFAMSYDLLLGFTGIVSFGHALFFGLGAYLVAIVMKSSGASWLPFLAAVLLTVVLAVGLAGLIGVLSLRVRDVYFAMVTLAFGELFAIGVEKWRTVTGGSDGFNFRLPEFLIDKNHVYFLSLFFMLASLLILRRFVNSPVGRVLLAIRENEPRAQALGYNTLHYKQISILVSGTVASLAGVMWAVAHRFVSTELPSLNRTIDALLMTIIGGTGTLYGGIVGSLTMRVIHDVLSGFSSSHIIFNRWLLIFGLIYILIVLFFPAGIIGSAAKMIGRWKERHPQIS
ncbi:MAG: branched-chain amino acid ABC transporter permease [Firmicutes bacterium]|nr:branched-chain amino acid ABC transporter permease [Bacillota bacterium]